MRTLPLEPCAREMRVYVHENSNTRHIKNSRVLLYLPHGFGDWVQISYVLPFLEPSNRYWTFRFNDHNTWLFDGNPYVTALHLGILDDGEKIGDWNLGIDLSIADGRVQTVMLPASLNDLCELEGIDTLIRSTYPDFWGHSAQPAHSKARLFLKHLASDSIMQSESLQRPLKSSINFEVPSWVRRFVESRLHKLGYGFDRKLCLINRIGYSDREKNWGHRFREDLPEGRQNEGQECRDFMRLLLQKDPSWMFLTMEDRLYDGDETVRSSALNCVSYAELFETVERTPLPFALVAKALVNIADLSIGVPTGGYHLSMAKPCLPTVGIWMQQMPSWYDEPKPNSRHIMSRNVRDQSLHERAGSFTAQGEIEFNSMWLDTRYVSGESVLEAVEDLIYPKTQRMVQALTPYLSNPKPRRPGEKLDLSDLTLLAVAVAEHEFLGTLRAIERCTSAASFGRIIVFSHEPSVFADVGDTVEIPSFNSHHEVAVWGIHEFPRYIDHFETHVLSIRWDSFIVNPAAWSDDFLRYDYIGAAWRDGVVGNDGFCLKSKRFIRAVAELGIPPTVEACDPHDAILCRKEFNGKKGYRSELEGAGMRFAPKRLAEKFSVADSKYAGSFGFYGREPLLDIVFKGLI